MYFKSFSVRALKACLMLRGSSVLFSFKSFKIDDENDGVGAAFFCCPEEWDEGCFPSTCGRFFSRVRLFCTAFSCVADEGVFK